MENYTFVFLIKILKVEQKQNMYNCTVINVLFILTIKYLKNSIRIAVSYFSKSIILKINSFIHFR